MTTTRRSLIYFVSVSKFNMTHNDSLGLDSLNFILLTLGWWWAVFTCFTRIYFSTWKTLHQEKNNYSTNNLLVQMNRSPNIGYYKNLSNLPSPLFCSISSSFLMLSSLAVSVCFCVSILISSSCNVLWMFTMFYAFSFKQPLLNLNRFFVLFQNRFIFIFHFS